jgi:hypothetical protein
MEPVFRPLCPRFRTLLTFVTLRHSDSIRASDPVRDCRPYKGKPILPQCWGKVAVHVRHHRTRPAGAFLVLKPQHFASMRKRGDAL